MEELLKGIYELTVKMKHCLNVEDFEDFEKLTNERNTLMSKVDEMKIKEQNYVYSSQEQQWLKNTLTIDQHMAPLLEEKLTETRVLLNQLKKQKQVSHQYRPIITQTSGIFLDSKR
ncbi:flagellar protein FliT [Neobacillus drentensis]|uniref:flagellar protein FliT n=1 Tax=Neobacillus drentensis TaxID=220684 RepID=UPI002FFDE438